VGSEADALLDQLGFSTLVSFGSVNWHDVPDTPGVYVIFDDAAIVYVGMAGRDGAGSLRKRLRDHASGQIVNMFAQYLLFARLLGRESQPRTPREAKTACRAHIAANCRFRVLSLADASRARATERELRERLRPEFNRLS
jgi:hypothetical protein